MNFINKDKLSSLPNLLIIGAMKCGTTSLHNYLAMHPNIFMSKNKEPNFFCAERDEHTINWYLNLFRNKENHHKYSGESSIGYSKSHEFSSVPQRIKNYKPDVKLIYIVREPIKRMISEYQYLKWRDEIDSKVEINSYFKDFNNTAIQTSCYYTNKCLFGTF